jgi:hypothetical protein
MEPAKIRLAAGTSSPEPTNIIDSASTNPALPKSDHVIKSMEDH